MPNAPEGSLYWERTYNNAKKGGVLLRPLWVINLLKKNFRSRFFLAKLTRVPGLGRIMEHLLFKDDDIIYLPKDNVIRVSLDHPIASPTSMALPSAIIDKFIDESNYHWIMNFCLCRDAAQCKDYPRDLGCLFLGEAASRIDPRLGRPVSKQEAHEHVARARREGLVHLIGRNKLDSVWLDVKPGEKLMTICNCCPCCCLWKMLPDLSPAISQNVTAMPGVKVEVTDACTGCSACTEGVCFVNAIRMEQERAYISDDCRGCGRCVDVCPSNAIALTVVDPTFFEQTMARLAAKVDVH